MRALSTHAARRLRLRQLLSARVRDGIFHLATVVESDSVSQMSRQLHLYAAWCRSRPSFPFRQLRC